MKPKFTAMGLSVVLLFALTHVHAATLIETEDSDDGVQKMWVEGSKMRMHTGKGGEFVVADYAKGEVALINPEEKEIIITSQSASAHSNHTKGLNVRVKHLGNGPIVAKYPTQKYALIVNGRTCDTTLVSAKALKDTNLGSLMEAMAKLDFNPMGSEFMNECDRAELLFAQRLQKLGLPLGTLDRSGKIRDKVRRIVKNAPLPPGGFTMPAGYRKISMQQKMKEAMGGAMPPGAPGQMDPAMQKKIQEMMRQQGH